MPRRDSRWDEDADDDFEDDDLDSGEDWTDDPDDDSATLPCPRCGRDVYEDAAYCPYCDADLSDDELRPYGRRRHPWWIILGTIACLLIFLSWIFLH
jgi:hypothetical protein